jgi:hypothetical protein
MNEINKLPNPTQTSPYFPSNGDNEQAEESRRDAVTSVANEIFTLSPLPSSSTDNEIADFFLERYPTPVLDFPEASPDPSPEIGGAQMVVSEPASTLPQLLSIAPAAVKKKARKPTKRDSLDQILKTHLKNLRKALLSPPPKGTIDTTFDRAIGKHRAHITATIKNYSLRFNLEYFKTHKDPLILENFENVAKLFNESSDLQMAGTVKFAGKWPELTALLCELIPDIESRVPDIKAKYSEAKMELAPPKKYIPKAKRTAEAQTGPSPKRIRTDSIEKTTPEQQPLPAPEGLNPSAFDFGFNFNCDEQLDPLPYDFMPTTPFLGQPDENLEDPLEILFPRE